MNRAQHPSSMIQFQVGEDGAVLVPHDTSSTECLLKRKSSPQRRPPVCRLATTIAFVFLVGFVTWQSVVDVGKDAGEKIEEVGKAIVDEVHEVTNKFPEAVALGEHANEMVYSKHASEKIQEVGKEIVQEVVNELPEVVEFGEHAHEMVHNMGGVKNMARYGAIVVARLR